MVIEGHVYEIESLNFLEYCMQSGKVVPEPIMSEILWGLRRLIDEGLLTAEEILYLYVFVTGKSYSEMSVRTIRTVQSKMSRILFRLQFLVGGCLYDSFLAYTLSNGDPETYEKILKGITSIRRKIARRRLDERDQMHSQEDV